MNTLSIRCFDSDILITGITDIDSIGENILKIHTIRDCNSSDNNALRSCIDDGEEYYFILKLDAEGSMCTKIALLEKYEQKESGENYFKECFYFKMETKKLYGFYNCQI